MYLLSAVSIHFKCNLIMYAYSFYTYTGDTTDNTVQDGISEGKKKKVNIQLFVQSPAICYNTRVHPAYKDIYIYIYIYLTVTPPPLKCVVLLLYYHVGSV